jgi:hypothetical protein
MIILGDKGQKRSCDGLRENGGRMKFMKEIHNVTLDNLPTKLEEIKIKAIWSWAFVPITVPYYLFHFFTRKRRR